MQHVAWQGELVKTAVILALGIASGATVDQAMYGLLAGLIVALLMALKTMSELYKWSFRQGPPPHDSGLIGYSVDKLILREKNLKQKLAQQAKQLRRYNQGIESLQDGVVLLDKDGFINNFNGAASRLLALRNDDLGQHVKNLIRTPRFIKYLDKGDYSDAIQFDVNHATPNQGGHSRELSLQLQITQFGIDQKVMLVRDVTERKRLETMRQNFIADVSHELRTPLTVINGYLEMLNDMELPNALNKAVSQMDSQGQRMKSLVNDLIELSKLESANSERTGHWFNLTQLGHSAVDQLQDYAQRHFAEHGGVNGNTDSDQAPIAFHCDDDIEINGFTDEISAVLTNLLTNAIKYGGGKPVSFAIARHEQGVQVSVSDRGPGIAPEHLARLTERFYRIDDSRESKIGGSGLGLAIVKHALENHDSWLQIDSTLTQGSTFSFVLPAERVR